MKNNYNKTQTMQIPLWHFYAKEEEIETGDYRGVKFWVFLEAVFRETTLQGVPMIIKQPGFLKKFFWVCAIAFCAVGLWWELDAFFSKFLSWTATTSVSVQTARLLPFPAITLCNNNPVTTDWYKSQQPQQPPSLPGAGGLVSSGVTSAALSGASLGITGVTAGASGSTVAPQLTGGAGGSTTPKLPLQRKRRALLRPPQGAMPPRPTLVDSLQEKLQYQEAAASVPYANRSEAGHQLCDMVLEMQYQGVSLAPGTNFSTWHWNPTYGNCFTFNAGYTLSQSGVTDNDTWLIKNGGVNGLGVRNSTHTGDTFGLYLLLNADIDHYLTVTRQAGWRIVIHNQTEAPFPEESGIFVAPGTSTRIGVSMNYVKRLGMVSNWLYNAPYSDCEDDSRLIVDDVRNAYSKILEVSYTKSACLKTCYQTNVMKTCKCFDYNYPDHGTAFGDIAYEPCSYKNTTLYQCQLYMQRQYQDGVLNCSCADTCSSYSFDTSISYLKWPNAVANTLPTLCQDIYTILMKRANNSDSTCVGRSYLPTQAANQLSGEPEIAKAMRKCFDLQKSCRGNTTPCDSKTYTDMSNYYVATQFAEVYVFYKDFNFQSIEENEFLALADLIAYMGGILGLFFGFTFLTLFEYVQFVIDLICLGVGRLCCRLLGKNTNKTGDSNTLINHQEQGKLPWQQPITPESRSVPNIPYYNRFRPGSVPTQMSMSQTDRAIQSSQLYYPGDPNYGMPIVKFITENDRAIPPSYKSGTSKKY